MVLCGGISAGQQSLTDAYRLVRTSDNAWHWGQAGELPSARHQHTATTIADKLYVVGGQQGAADLPVEGQEVFVMDSTTATWQVGIAGADHLGSRKRCGWLLCAYIGLAICVYGRLHVPYIAYNIRNMRIKRIQAYSQGGGPALTSQPSIRMTQTRCHKMPLFQGSA
jgi:Kelch motif